MSSTVSVQSHVRPNPATWLAAKVVLAVVAICLTSLLVAALELRLGTSPSDSPIVWELSGE